MVLKRTFVILLFTLHSPAHAGDEDMNPTAYQIFDPVTGYMIPVDPPPSQQHAQPSQNTMTKPAPQSNVVNQQAVPDNSVTEDPTPSPLWMYLVAGAMILGGFAAWVRNRGKISNSNLD